MNRSAARSVFSPRVKASPSVASPRLSKGGGTSATRKSLTSRSADHLSTPSKRVYVSGEDIERLEKKIDDLCLQKSLDDRAGAQRTEQALKLKNEELQAVMSELTETKSSLVFMERKYRMAHTATQRLEKENKAQATQLEEIRQEQMENRRRSMNRRILEERKDHKSNIMEEDDENVGDFILKQGLRREDKLAEEVWQLKQQLEKERGEFKSSMADMLIALKAAVGLKEEAEAELHRINQRATDEKTDSVWNDLMRRWNGGTKRHSLLQWVNYKLTPYPSLKVSNFTDDWCDGKAFCALVHAHRPDLVTRSQLHGDCVALTGQLAASLQMTGVGDMFIPSPDWNHTMTVVFSLYRKFSEEEEQEN